MLVCIPEKRPATILLGWSTLFVVLFSAAAARAAVPRTVALTGVTLIDGTGRPAISPAVVVIRGDRILLAGALARIKVPAGATVVDLPGKWLIPGLVDAHVHFFETGRLYTKAPAQSTAEDAPKDPLDYQDIVPYAAEAAWARSRIPLTLRGYLCAGVTTALSMGGPPFEQEVKQRARHLNAAPNIFTVVGPIATVPPEKIFPSFPGGPSSVLALTAWDGKRAVTQGVRDGVDAVKLLRFDIPGEADPAAVFSGAIEAAHAGGLPVFVHEFNLARAKQWILMGVDVMAHTVAFEPVDAEFIALVKSRHIVNVTTANIDNRLVAVVDRKPDLLPIERRCGDADVIASWSHVRPSAADQGFRDQAARNNEDWKDNLRLLYQSGALIATGSDAGNIGLLHGASLHRELLTLSEIGVPPIDIIEAATLHGAIAIHKSDELGSIEPGKLADMLVLDRDPLADIGNVQSIVTVIKRGRFWAAGQLTPLPRQTRKRPR